MLRCNTCGGVYEPLGRDGLRYFHRCPSLSSRELQTLHASGRLVLSASTAAQLAAAIAADADTPPKPGDLSHVEQVWGSLVIDRPNTRDENVVPDPQRDTEGRPRLEGAGVTALPADVDDVVVDAVMG